ncbi:GNAT family N-acetyltransferase [Gordonia effusa]|nr:GNAT family N-acetyltransferase [Gordonia effusa]
MTIELVAPKAVFWESWLEARREWGGPEAHQPGAGLWAAERLGVDLDSRDGFDRWVDALNAQPGAAPSSEVVPATNWWIVRGGRYVGAIQLRHSLNDLLADLGGHVGYGIRPSERRKGIATLALRTVLAYAWGSIGLVEVLITCDETNVGSRRVIESSGGVLDSIRESDELSRGHGHVGNTLRYRVAR